MIAPFVEGVRSVEQVCHLVILAPVALAMVAARGRLEAVGGAILGIVVGGWVFVANWVGVSDLVLRLSALFVIAAVAALAFTALSPEGSPGWLDTSVTRFGLTAATGLVVTQWWRPCVGEELGTILTNAPDSPIGQLPATVGFMLGISVPLVVIGLVIAAVRPSERVEQRASLVAGAVGVVVAGSVVAGQHGEIVARLFQWSQ